MKIRTKQFQILTDIELVWKLMTDVYNHDETNGLPAPFFEYAVISSWLDKDYLRLNRFWLDGDLPVAFVFYENPVTSTYFVLRPGYEFLAGEMIEYAESAYPIFDEPREMILLSGQTALIEAAGKLGYYIEYEQIDRFFDFRKGKLDYPLPDGYHFIDAGKSDPLKSARCLWDGFNSEEFGEFCDWETPKKAGGRSPHELYQNVLCATISPSPHATYDYTVIIADRNEDYVCFSGMWWVPENRLAYMEPLCTVPAHQNKGLAAAALSRHDQVMRDLGAEIMTGGGNDFYKKIGYQGVHRLFHMKKRHVIGGNRELEISKISSLYEIRRLDDSDADCILSLCRKNTQFYEYCEAEPTREQVLGDLHITPPGIGLSDKYYIGFYQKEMLVAVMDLIDGYPEPEIAFIGFFMMNKNIQGHGIGTAIIQETAAYLKTAGKTAIRLAIDKGNPQSTHFWKKNGFIVIKEVDRNGWTVLVAEKKL